MRISNLLDCTVLGSMAMLRMWNFWVVMLFSFFYRCPFLFVWLFVASLVYVMYTLSFGQYIRSLSIKKKIINSTHNNTKVFFFSSKTE